ncbi:MAG: DipZ protein [Solirubrobacteraceae bacterium]
MRPPVDTIAAPPFPRDLTWCNVAPLRMDKQLGRPVLIEFCDLLRVQSVRTLPYVQAWYERYAEDGLRVISVHAPGYEPGRDEDVARQAIIRLAIEHPVCLDTEFALWRLYDNEGWPARYLFDGRLRLAHFHYGEGGYAETEEIVQELLGVERELLEPLRPEDDPEALIVVPTAEQPGSYCGPYEAGGVWAVFSGAGIVHANGIEVAVDHAGAYPLVEHPGHTAGMLELEVGEGVTCHATVFTPGVAG